MIMFLKKSIVTYVRYVKKSFWNFFWCFQTYTSLKSQERAKMFQKMPNVLYVKYGTLFEEDNFPSINLPFFSTFRLSQSYLGLFSYLKLLITLQAATYNLPPIFWYFTIILILVYYLSRLLWCVMLSPTLYQHFLASKESFHE